MLVLEAGTTLRASVEFRNYDGQLIDVDDATLKIYDVDMEEISTDTDGVSRESLGVYSCLYETPMQNTRTTYYAEFSGIVGTKTVLVRTPFQTKFDV